MGPPVTCLGIQCLKVTPKSRILGKIVFNRLTWQSNEQHYVSTALKRIRQNARDEEASSIPSIPTGSSKDVGGAGLLADHSSEEEEPADEPEDAVAVVVRPRKSRPVEWVLTKIKDIEVKVLLTRGYAMHIEYTGEAICALCHLIADVRREYDLSPPVDYSNLLTDADVGRIKHNRFKKWFLVTTRSKSGNLQKKHFGIPDTSIEDDVIKLLKFARSYWNRYDSGRRERYSGAHVQLRVT